MLKAILKCYKFHENPLTTLQPHGHGAGRELRFQHKMRHRKGKQDIFLNIFFSAGKSFIMIKYDRTIILVTLKLSTLLN